MIISNIIYIKVMNLSVIVKFNRMIRTEKILIPYVLI